MTSDSIENLSSENRSFAPSAEFAAAANAKADLYAQADADRLKFWESQAEALTWHKKWDSVLEWQSPFAKWFVGGKLNATVSTLDRHVQEGRGARVAFHFEGEPGDTRTITYADLLAEVSQAAHALTEIGITSGDRVAIYMPLIPEAVVAMLACARIGAIHSVVFGGFSAKSLQERIIDAGAVAVITADEQMRGGKALPLKTIVDEALALGGCENIKNVIIYKRTGGNIPFKVGLDSWMHEVTASEAKTCDPEWVSAEHPLFILYTSGSTGKPKGVQHSTGGYLLWAILTMKWTFDIKPSDIFWCTADIGWVTGHSYIAYGPLAVGGT
ncbi:MAG: acetyl-coenzyme A synthetase, partial [Burkholderiaceae bacterium]|nr:acetyl-coenzyme A synthetase [Burkholderiaceae bacterium]